MESSMAGHQRLNQKLVKEFYSSSLFEPSLPKDSKHRHYRFKNLKGRWVKVRRRIRNATELKSNVAKLEGGDLYYSTSTWLNPDKIKSAEEEDVTKTILLKNDLVFDFDCEDPYSIETLELARKSAFNVGKAMKKYEDRFVLDYCAFSGKKGFRLSYEDLNPVSVQDPKERIAQVTRDRKVFITELLQYIRELKTRKEAYDITTRIDEKVTTNPLCVVRVLGSVHTKTGFITQKIPFEWLKKHTKDILKEISCVFTKRPGIPSVQKAQREMTMDKDLSPRPRPLYREGKDVSGLASSHHYFVSNKVVGTKCYVPVFIYQKGKKDLQRELSRLQKEFELGTLYLLQDANEIQVLSLKLFQKRQMIKMLNKTTSRTKTMFKKYNECFFPLNTVLYEEMESSCFSGQSSKSHRIWLETKKEKDLQPLSLESQSTLLKISKGVETSG